MSCKILTEVTKTIADVLQDLHRSHKDITTLVISTRMLRNFSTELTTNIIRRCFASSKQTSQRQSPMYCKILTEVTKTIADVLQDLHRSHKDITTLVISTRMLRKFSTELTTNIIRRCFASSKADVTKTIADVLQDLNRSHKDNRRCIARSL